MRWFPFNFDDSIVSLYAYDGINRRDAFPHVEVLVSYGNEYTLQGTRVDFAELAVRRFEEGRSNIH